MTTNTTTDAGTSSKTAGWTEFKPTALLVLADGTVIEGKGLGATGIAKRKSASTPRLPANEEILTDPSYAGQIVTFTFPHIGNVGTNKEDIEDLSPANRAGALAQSSRPTLPRLRAIALPPDHLDHWLKARGVIALWLASTPAL